MLLVVSVGSLRAQRLQFESDELQLEDKTGRVVLTGNVHAWNDTGWIKSDRLEIYYESGGDTVKYYQAYGNVRLRYPNVHGEARYAFRDVRADTMILQGDAYVRRGGDEFWADRIRVNLKTSAVRMTDNVRGNLVPRNEEDDAVVKPDG